MTSIEIFCISQFPKLLKCCPFSFIFNLEKENYHKKLYQANVMDDQALRRVYSLFH